VHCSFAINGLGQIVAGVMVAIANPVVEGLLFGRIRKPAKLESKAGDSVLHKASLVGADEAVLIGLLVELNLNVIELSRGPSIISER
jgi:hypothetical protein